MKRDRFGNDKDTDFLPCNPAPSNKTYCSPIGNEVITLVKDTSLARIIANKEIIMMAGEYSNKGLIWPLFATGIYSLFLSGFDHPA